MAESTERVLDAAEALFLKGGYAAVKLKHIAEYLDVKESSLYYHFPRGKEELYVAAMHRAMRTHHEGIRNAIATAGDDWVAQLRAVARWLLSQPPLDVVRMNHADLPAIDAGSAAAITEAAYAALNLPVKQILEGAVERQLAVVEDPDLIAGIFIGAISLLDIVDAQWNPRTKEGMADVLIDSWVNGMRKR